MNYPSAWRIAFSRGLLCLLFSLLISLGCHGSNEEQKESTQAAPIAAIAIASHTPLNNMLNVAGEFLPYQEVELHAKVAGYIRHISVDIGDRVKAGQVLATLDVPELTAQV